ncbi:hypothetical protein [Phaeodactylibacter sp.]|jgi:hypothetical protein|uniref:hypothetical protein n=1 Tax=Phaeodactylibacter sp. TaxID=1940289 RepID=UPI0025DAA5CD|nr:hypothetical protein [Phaeodactylibacter sp.]MCI4647244.1 hypothetical protein [Phaeodactylibacter sp.]MCI5089598.1 hypothetical protein [Phaeodactylibacter sp.]
MKNCLIFIGILISSIHLSAQHEGHSKAESQEHETTHEGPEHKYKMALAFGYNHIPDGFEEGGEESVFAPSIGLDFFYALNHKFALGMVADLELAEYAVDLNRESLERERAFILAILGAYEVLPHWELLLGGGIELERHRNLGVVRFGTEYEIDLGQGWIIGPSLFFDIKEEFNVWAFTALVGKRF